MCGILGITVQTTTPLSTKELQEVLRTLFLLSESRGKEASGFAVLDPKGLLVTRSNMTASQLVKSPAYREVMDARLAKAMPERIEGLAVIGHSRLVTTGSQYSDRNNQPVRSGDVVCIHNGIVVNYQDIWRLHPKWKRTSDVDTETIAALVNDCLRRGESLPMAVQSAFSAIRGTASVAILSALHGALVLASNNGSLYVSSADGAPFSLFGSERHIVEKTIADCKLERRLGRLGVEHVAPGRALLVDLKSGKPHWFGLCVQEGLPPNPVRPTGASIDEQSILRDTEVAEKSFAQRSVGILGAVDKKQERRVRDLKRHFPHESSWQDSLRRCTRCVLPETMPFIDFDEQGVCNYCRFYKPLHFHGVDQLRKEIENITPGGPSRPNCLVGISGGRDSLYAVHYVKNVLGLWPVTYTYDWGMVTDLARRNIARICGKLGLEHIIVSADIPKKRRWIRSNVRAWLKRPSLGMIPLFMAGDKEYFYHLNRLKKQLGVSLAILGENMLEKTDFKAGFTGVPPYRGRQHIHTLPFRSVLKMASFYGKEYLLNPGYINGSLIDTAFASVFFYGMVSTYVNLYSYIPWIEEELITTIRSEYDFELAPDTVGTWRIGDGTSAFYNYIYYTVAGFTENDTFRSNQIREGLISRDEALKHVRAENQPRYETIDWYLDIIGLDLPVERVFEIINRIPKVVPAHP